MCITRTCGSGGGSYIGKKLAKDFDIDLYDRKLLRLAAEDSGINEKIFAAAAATTVVNAPGACHVIALDETGDPVFASRALGEGVGILPTDSEGEAPVSGVLQTVAETGHAFGINTDDGVEVLVHVGIDTVKMNGEGFHVAVSANQRVNAGATLETVDYEKVKEAGYSTTTLMTVLNTAALAGVTPKTGVDVQAGQEVLDIQR